LATPAPLQRTRRAGAGGTRQRLWQKDADGHARPRAHRREQRL